MYSTEKLKKPGFFPGDEKERGSQGSIKTFSGSIQRINGSCLLSIFERNGNVHISWKNCGRVGKHDFVALYKGPTPENPTDGRRKVWHKYKISGSGECDTGLPWGPDWSAGYCGRVDNPVAGCQFVYYIHTGLTRTAVPGAGRLYKGPGNVPHMKIFSKEELINYRHMILVS
ncbi:MAG: hypothetical protein GY940_33910 [bacterium]|nr:hypothetical protein [bacterium]